MKGDRRRDRLSSLIIAARRGDYTLTERDAALLLDAQFALATSPEPFDSLTYWTMWGLLPYSPPHQPLRKLMMDTLADRRYEWRSRGAAITYLLSAYPEERAALIDAHRDDEAPEVLDAIAHALAPTDRREALRMWERVLASPELSHELAETTPFNLAYVADELDKLRFEQMDRDGGGGTLWGIAAALIEPRDVTG
jgi:hypothetical protein